MPTDRELLDQLALEYTDKVSKLQNALLNAAIKVQELEKENKQLKEKDNATSVSQQEKN